jgi:hypothetical protein
LRYGEQSQQQHECRTAAPPAEYLFPPRSATRNPPAGTPLQQLRSLACNPSITFVLISPGLFPSLEINSPRHHLPALRDVVPHRTPALFDVACSRPEKSTDFRDAHTPAQWRIIRAFTPPVPLAGCCSGCALPASRLSVDFRRLIDREKI